MYYSKSSRGFHDATIHADIPADAVEITTVYHAELLAAQSDGRRIEPDASGYPVAVEPQAPTMVDVQAAAAAAIDIAAGAARARYITTANGQDATYLLKAADADRYKAAGYPAAQIATYPWVRAKARSTVPDPTAADYQAAADLIISTRDAWVDKGANIEQARESGKRAVASAATLADAVAAKDAAVAVLDTI